MRLSLLEYLTKLSTDSEMTAAYKKDRESAMREAKVSEEDIKLVINNDYDAIKKTLGTGYDISINHFIQVFKKS